MDYSDPRKFRHRARIGGDRVMMPLFRAAATVPPCIQGGPMMKFPHGRHMLLAALLACHGAAIAQGYPNQPVRMLVGYAAGGGADGVIRAIAPELSEALGQPIVIDNRPGGGTVIATQAVGASKPDGYTMYVMDHAFIVNPVLVGKLPYDSLRDFVPVSAVSSSSTTLMVVHPSLPVKSVKELVALARAHPGKLNYSSGGNGTVPHVMGELFNTVAKIRVTHIPYKSTGLAIYATTSGEVMVGFGGIFAAKGLADTGKLRALAIAAGTRSDIMPQVPTFAESGWPQIDATSHRGIIAPANTPREAVTRMNAAINKVLQIPAVRARMTEVGYVITGGSPEEFGRLIRSEMDKWAKILRDANIRVE
jgi:tripartite-type tricarboxylate transporter receptor subunit TctC